MKKSILLLFLAVWLWSSSQAQTLEWSDNRIAKLFDRMDYWGDFCYKDPHNKKVDSLRVSGGRIYDFVEDLIVMYPYALDGDFPKAKEKGLHYVTSDDGQLRIYSWLAKMEGHEGVPHAEYRDVAGFKTSAGRKYHDISNGTEGAYCTNITMVQTKKNIPIYLVNYYTVHDGIKMEKIKAYALKDGGIREISSFIDGTKNPKQLWCDYALERGHSETDAPEIHLSPDKQKLYVPVTERVGGRYVLTDKYEVFLFNGFMYINEKPAGEKHAVEQGASHLSQ